MRAFLVLLLCCCAAEAQIRVVAQPSRSPLVDFRIVFLTRAAYDPADKPGLASLTAAQIAGGGTRELSYKQVLDAMFPMAASLASQVDKEMIVFRGTTDIHNLEKYYALFRGILLTPPRELAIGQHSHRAPARVAHGDPRPCRPRQHELDRGVVARR